MSYGSGTIGAASGSAHPRAEKTVAESDTPKGRRSCRNDFSTTDAMMKKRGSSADSLRRRFHTGRRDDR